jgi:hypothetical protein
MATQPKKGGFGLKSAFSAVIESAASHWKPLLVAAPLIGAALFFASATHAQLSGSTAPPTQPTDSTTVAPKPAPAAARRKGRGPKEKMGEEVGRTASPTTTTDPATPTQATTPITPIDVPDAGRRKGPKGDSGSDAQGSTEVPAPDSAPAEERRREGPKGAGESGRTEAPAPDTQPAGRRREGPKGAVDHGRTSTTPLIIGALGTAAVLALVVSSGNDRPASP